VRVYWSHCGSSRIRYSNILGTPPIETWDDVTRLGKEVKNKGFTALKTNVLLPGQSATFGGGSFGASGATDQVAPKWLIPHIETLIGTFRDAVGDDIDINLDLNFHFKTEACLRIAKVLEKFDMLWLEIDMYDSLSLRQIKDSTDTRICTGENLFYMSDYLPYFENHSADMFMIDVPWNGFSQSEKDWRPSRGIST
jgi:L-alanine-DL-glutamate epimerase-like enolase superfamily enzyme